LFLKPIGIAALQAFFLAGQIFQSSVVKEPVPKTVFDLRHLFAIPIWDKSKTNTNPSKYLSC